jgi:hypothetical protein
LNEPLGILNKKTCSLKIGLTLGHYLNDALSLAGSVRKSQPVKKGVIYRGCTTIVQDM